MRYWVNIDCPSLSPFSDSIIHRSVKIQLGVMLPYSLLQMALGHCIPKDRSILLGHSSWHSLRTLTFSVIKPWIMRYWVNIDCPSLSPFSDSIIHRSVKIQLGVMLPYSLLQMALGHCIPKDRSILLGHSSWHSLRTLTFSVIKPWIMRYWVNIDRPSLSPFSDSIIHRSVKIQLGVISTFTNHFTSPSISIPTS
jgi:hypothetical protein